MRRLILWLLVGLVATQMIFVATPAKAANDGSTTGFAVENVSGKANADEVSFVDDMQQVSVSGATSGTFRLRYRGDSTDPLPYNATAVEIQNELQLLPYVISDVGPVSVTGGDGGPWDVNFPNPTPPGKLNGLIAEFGGLDAGFMTIDANKDLPIDPSGVAFIGSKNLAIVDNAIKSKPAPVNDGNVNLWWIPTNASPLTVNANNTVALAANEPSGLAYDSAANRLFVSEFAASRIWQMSPNGSGASSVAASGFGASNPKDVAWDPVAKELYIAAGNGQIKVVTVGNNGLQGSDPVARTINLSGIATNLNGLEGLGFRSASRTLLVTDSIGPNGLERIYEVTRQGRLVRTLDLKQVSTPSDVTVGPNDVLYVVDKHVAGGPNTNETVAQDGRLWKVYPSFTNLKPFVNAGPNKSVDQDKSVSIAGDTYDDDQSKPAPVVKWAKQAGPGTVTFANSSALNTSATFSKAGTYALRLTSTDTTGKSNTDTLTVTVKAVPGGGGGGGGGGGNGTFKDDDGHTFEADIEWMAASGITKGCNPPVNDKFCPNDPVTRGQMAAFMVRALGYTAGAGANLFVDDNGHTFENDIDRFGTAGVTKGCNPPTNNRYCPNEYVTRGQMAAFMTRAFEYTAGAGANLFIDDNGHTFENDIDLLGTAGVTKGCNPPTNNRYCPNEVVTRGQMAAFMHRALGD